MKGKVSVGLTPIRDPFSVSSSFRRVLGVLASRVLAVAKNAFVENGLGSTQLSISWYDMR